MEIDGSDVSLDHVVYLVPNLASASRNAANLGFTVSPGGTHAGGLTRNALIGFRDGTYLELLEFTVRGVRFAAGLLTSLRALPAVLRRRTPLDRRFVPRARWGTGVIDFALSRKAGLGGPTETLVGEGPVRGKRVRDDGVTLEWEMFFPDEPMLPFFLHDITERALRVPAPDACRHANGVEGFTRVEVTCPQRPADLAVLLGRAVGGTPRGGSVDLAGATVCFREQGSPRYGTWLRTSQGERPLPSLTDRSDRS